MTERGSEKIVLTGVRPEEIQVALGYLGVSGYSMEIVPDNNEVDEPPRLGYATKDEFIAFAENSPNYDHLQTPGGLWSRLRRHRAVEQGKILGPLVGKEEPVELFKLIPKEGELPEEAMNLDTLSLMLGADTLQYVAFVGKKMERFAREFIASRVASLEAAERQGATEGSKLGYASLEELSSLVEDSTDYGPLTPNRLWYGLYRWVDNNGNLPGNVVHKYDTDVELFKEFRVNGMPPQIKINMDTLSELVSAGTIQGFPNLGAKIERLAQEFIASRIEALEESGELQ